MPAPHRQSVSGDWKARRRLAKASGRYTENILGGRTGTVPPHVFESVEFDAESMESKVRALSFDGQKDIFDLVMYYS